MCRVTPDIDALRYLSAIANTSPGWFQILSLLEQKRLFQWLSANAGIDIFVLPLYFVKAEEQLH